MYYSKAGCSIITDHVPTAIQWQPVANMMSKRFTGAAEVFLQCSHIFKFCMENNIENANSFRDMARERYERNYFRGRHKFFSGWFPLFFALIWAFFKIDYPDLERGVMSLLSGAPHSSDLLGSYDTTQ